MIRQPLRLVTILGLIAAVFHGGAFAQVVPREANETPIPRVVLRKDDKMREHEARIREIIRQRQEEARKRAEQERLENEKQAVEQGGTPPQDAPSAVPGGGGAPPASDGAPREARAVGAVMLYYNFPRGTKARSLDTAVRTGEEFISEVVLLNEAGADITGIRLALSYDKRFLEPVRVFDSQLRPLLSGEPEYRIDGRDGVLYYSGTLTSPTRGNEFIPLRVLWRALRPTTYTNLNFLFETEATEATELTAVLQDERNILGVGFDPIDGVLGGGVVIDPPVERERRLQGKAEELRTMYLDAIAAHSNAGLVITPPADAPRVGDVFPVRVALNNPDGTLIDSVDFTLSWDPTVLELVDQDRGNWIRRGLNAHDGPFRADYPFNYFKNNEARNERGLLRYSAGMTEGSSLPSGTFAVAYFRARRATLATTVRFVESRPGEPNLTSIRYFGFEVSNLTEGLSRPAIAIAIGNPEPGREAIDARQNREAPASPEQGTGGTLIRVP